MITAAIFDIDGTLLDSMDMWNHAGEEYLHSLGIQPKPGLAERMMPLSTPKSAQLLQREYALEKSVSEIIDGINGTVRSAYLHTVPLKPGVKDFLEEMKSKKIPMTAATSTDRCVIEGALARLGISDYFAHLFTCTEVGAGKLKPDIYIAAQEFMHSSRNSTWVFEDSLFAAKTARAAGFPVAGVYDQYTSLVQEDIRSICHIFLPALDHFREFYDAASKFPLSGTLPQSSDTEATEFITIYSTLNKERKKLC